jgi:hypothetical protein
MLLSELAIGDKFIYKGIAYTKIKPEKVSCCKTYTATKDENNQKVMIKPNEKVEKVSE